MKYSFEHYKEIVACGRCPLMHTTGEGERFDCVLLRKEVGKQIIDLTKHPKCPLTEEVVWHPARG